jgi:hypothetical protein
MREKQREKRVIERGMRKRDIDKREKEIVSEREEGENLIV